MEDIKLWELDGTQATPLGSNNQLESEQGLEDTLVKNPRLLMEELTLVGRQTPTEGGPLDLLGVDGDGKLVVFKLKRGTLLRDAVAQILDYSSNLDSMDSDSLAHLISEGSGKHGIDQIEDFQEWYEKQGFGDLESLKPLRMFLIGLGADEKTERMVRFLAKNSGMDISLLTFHAFDYGGKTILAKQVEVEAASEPERHGSSSRTYRRSVTLLESRAKEIGTFDLLAAVKEMFLDTWQRKLRQTASTTRLNFFVSERSKSGRRSTPTYLSLEIDTENGGIRVCFYPRAIELCKDQFDRLDEEEFRFIKEGNPQALPTTGQVDWQILVPLGSLNEWKTHKERLTVLTRSVYEAWQNESQDDGADLA